MNILQKYRLRKHYKNQSKHYFGDPRSYDDDKWKYDFTGRILVSFSIIVGIIVFCISVEFISNVVETMCK